MIELRQLKYFLKVAELEHFGQAAQALHVVQPALSRQVKQLEEELGVELFERLPRGVRLSAAGKVLLERTNQLMADLDRAILVTKQAAAGKNGFVRVGFADGATYSGHVTSIIREFRKRVPDVEVELVAASSIDQAEMLASGAIDIGFVYWLPKDRSGVSSKVINEEKIVLAAAHSRKVANKKSLRLLDLRDTPFIWFKREQGPSYYDLIVSRCSKAGLTMDIVQEAFTESTMLSLVSADIGVTFITEAARHRKPDNVVLVPIKDLHATISLTAMWRTEDRNPATKQFLSFVGRA